MSLRTWSGTPPARWTIIGLHLVLLGVLFAQQGLQTDKEALKYVGCAEAVIRGDLTDLLGNYLKYAAYILFLLPFVAIGVPGLAIAGQVVLGIVAAVALGRLVERMSGDRVLGQATVGLLLLCPIVQVWTLALYTESFFTSSTLLFMERITRKTRPDLTTLLLALVVLFARPVGMLFVGPAIIWRITGHAGALRWRIPGYAAVLVVAMSLPGIRAAQLEPIVDAHVIAGFPEDPGAMKDFTGSSIGAAQRFLIHRHGPQDWAWLALRRMASLYTLPRPYYSVAHNLINGVWMLLYPISLWGCWRFRGHAAMQLIMALLTLQTTLVGLTHDEWSGRFIVPLLPWIIAMAVLALPAVGSRSGPH